MENVKQDNPMKGMRKNEKRAFLLGQIELSKKLEQFAKDGTLLLQRELEELEKSM